LDAGVVARAAATREGLSVGDWLTRRILSENARSLAGQEARTEPAGTPAYRREDDPRRERDELMIRLARSEAEADAAFRRIDEALRTLTRRLESNERTQNEAQRAMSSAASEISAASRDQAEAFVLLTQRIDRVEQTGDAGALRDAVRGLHQGLSRLAEQIARTASESSEHIAALTANLDTMAGKLGSTRDDLMRLEQSVEERLTALAGRLSTVEENTQPAGRVEETVTQLHSRLDSAEERLQQGLSEHLAAIERNLHGITAKLEAAGFTVQRARSNIGHNAKRMTFLAHAR